MCFDYKLNISLKKLVFSFLKMDKNIDRNEVNKFAELADKWWDSSGN